MITDRLTKLTNDYIAQTDDLIQNRRPGEGIFGLPDSDTAEQLVRFLLAAEDSFPCSQLASWTLLAVQRLSLPLIPHLSTDAKKDLSSWFGKKVPRLQRMPVQQEIYKELKK